MKRRLEDSDYRQAAMDKGFIWLGSLPKNVNTATAWQCPKGHTWNAKYADVKYHGTGCPLCSKTAKKTSQDYESLARSRGYKWVGKVPVLVLEKTEWECNKGHRWQARYAGIQQGYGCPHCAGVTKKEEKDYIQAAVERGFVWVGPKVSSTHEKTGWKCHCGHIWNATYANIKHNQNGCPKCAGCIAKVASDYNELAKARGFKWLGPEVHAVNRQTKWQCPKGHIWKAAFSNIQIGQGCPKCAYEKRGEIFKIKPVDYKKLAKQRGFTWLGPEVNNSRTHTNWQCKLGHKWKTSYSTILRGRGCPICSNRLEKTPEDYFLVAKERGFKWAGPAVENTHLNTTWECSRGHQWTATYHNIKYSKSGCPYCLELINGQRVSKNQIKLAKLLSGDVNKSVGRYKIDVAIERNNHMVAIEYDSWYWHGGRERIDDVRDTYIISKGWRILRIRSNNKMPKLYEIEKALSEITMGKQKVILTLSDWGKGPAKALLEK